MKFFTFIAIFLAVGGLEALEDGNWTYDLQGEWSPNYNQFIGMRQSPINIETCTVIEKKCEKCLTWTNYHDNHPNMTIIYAKGCVTVTAAWKGIPTVSNGALTNEYKLEQFHFHLSQKDYDGSEHCINSFKRPMEVHFIHIRNCFSCLTEALASKEEDAVVVVARLFKITNTPNQGLQPIVNAIRSGKTSTCTTLKLASLMGCGLSKYYSYLGSLSSPEYNEVVRWIIFDEVYTLSRQQIEVFRCVKYNDEKVHPNFRLLQPINRRPIYQYKC